MVSIFDYLRSILFTKKNIALDSFEDEKGFDMYMINRWCSMVDKDCAQIINQTTNRFGTHLETKTRQYNFLKDVTPLYKYKKINYIKRKTVE